MKYLCLLLISLPAFGQFGAASRILSGTGAPVAAQCTVENNVGLVWARKDGADVGTTFYVCGATGVGTYGWELRGGAPGGASALTTPGSVPFVTAAGVLGQDADFSFASATDRMIVGNASAGSNSAAYSGYAVWAHKDQQNAAGIALLQGPSGDTYLNSAAAAALVFRIGATEGFRLAPTTRNLLLGTTTDDGTNRLQVAGAANVTGNIGLGANNATSQSIALNIRPGNDGSTSSGASVIYSLGGNIYSQMQLFGTTASSQFLHDIPSGGTSWRTYSGFNSLMSLSAAGALELRNQTPTTGSTSLVVRAGAGQTGNLQTWQSAAAGVIAYVNSQGGFASNEFYNTNDRFYQNSAFVDVGSALLYRFSSTVLQGGAKDLSLSRASANTLQVGDGGANANGVLRVQRITSPTTLIIQPDSGTAVMGWGNGFSIPNGTGGAGVSLSGNSATPFLMDVGASGSSGSARIYDQTPTVGSTSLVVRAGAGQSGNLTTWQDSAGATVGSINASGVQQLTSGMIAGSNFVYYGAGQIQGYNALSMAWSSTGAYGGTKDLALSRFAAGRLEINSGTAIGTTPANARDIMARGFYAAETTTDPSAADLTIAGSNTQDVAAIYVKNDKLVVAYNRSGTVNYLTIPLDGATTTFTQSTTAP